MRQLQPLIVFSAAWLSALGCRSADRGTEPESSSVSHWLSCDSFADCSDAKEAVACEEGYCVGADGERIVDEMNAEEQPNDAGGGGNPALAMGNDGGAGSAQGEAALGGAGNGGANTDGSAGAGSTLDSNGGSAGQVAPSPTASTDLAAGGSTQTPDNLGGGGIAAGSEETPSNEGGRSGAGGLSGVAGMSGAGGASQQGCEDGAARCNAESGVRELCEGGQWAPGDFVCAASVWVENNNGSACAVKADGTFRCWSIGGSELTVESPVAPGEVKGVYPVVGNATNFAWLTQDDTFIDEDGAETPGVLGVASASGDTCLIVSDRSASCTMSGPIPVDSVAQLAVSSTMRCALQQSGEVYCADRQGSAVTIEGPFAAIAVAYDVLCAIDTQGIASCAYLNEAFSAGAEPSSQAVLPGNYEKIAMTDVVVCGVGGDGALDCAGFAGSEPFTQPGSFVDVAGGDFTFAAIRTDGSVLSWFNETPIELPVGW